jgi:hypothetical protein
MLEEEGREEWFCKDDSFWEGLKSGEEETHAGF